jgi:hypothetical protein
MTKEKDCCEKEEDIKDSLESLLKKSSEIRFVQIIGVVMGFFVRFQGKLDFILVCNKQVTIYGRFNPFFT